MSGMDWDKVRWQDKRRRGKAEERLEKAQRLRQAPQGHPGMFKSKYAGKCFRCDGPYKVGDQICRYELSDRFKYVHADCSPSVTERGGVLPAR